MTKLFLPLFVVLLAVASVAQSVIPVRDPVGAAQLVYSDGVLVHRRGSESLGSIRLPLDQCVGGVQLPSQHAAVVAGNGRDGDAILHCVGFGAEGLRRLDTVRIPRVSIDAIALQADWGRVFVADCMHGTLWSAPLDGALPEPRSWTIAARRREIHELTPRAGPRLILVSKPDALVIQRDGLAAATWTLRRAEGEVGRGPEWSTIMARTSVFPTSGPWVEVLGDLGVAGPVTVRASIDGAAHLAEHEGAGRWPLGDVRAGVLTELLLPAELTLQPGTRYRVAIEAGGETTESAALHAFSRPAAGSGVVPVDFGPPQLAATRCTLDSATFGAYCQYVFARGVGASDLAFWALFATRRAGGSDPWRSHGDATLLVADRVLMLPATAGEAGGTSRTAASLWLEESAFDVGDEVYCQFVCLDENGQQVALSGIVGLPVTARSEANRGSPPLRDAVRATWHERGATDPASVAALLERIVERLRP